MVEAKMLPYSEKHIFWGRLVELEDVIGWKPQAVLLSEETKKAAVQRRYTYSRQERETTLWNIIYNIITHRFFLINLYKLSKKTYYRNYSGIVLI